MEIRINSPGVAVGMTVVWMTILLVIISLFGP
jgi:hypothetical protein